MELLARHNDDAYPWDRVGHKPMIPGSIYPDLIKRELARAYIEWRLQDHRDVSDYSPARIAWERRERRLVHRVR
jgi:hypothetical protein